MTIAEKRDLNGLVRHGRKDAEVSAVILFGSSAHGKSGKGSDVDVCLLLQPRPYGAKELSGKKLAYLKLFDLDVQVFQQLPLYLKKRVIAEGRILLCKDENALYDTAFSVIREFADFEHIYRDYLKEVAHAG